MLFQLVFFGRLSVHEARRLAERLINYVLFKAVFVGAVVEPDVLELALWAILLSSLGYLKVGIHQYVEYTQQYVGYMQQYVGLIHQSVGYLQQYVGFVHQYVGYMQYYVGLLC